ncbi:MAG: hypothetical protein ACYCYF_01405 [Anaerolineae bacterium]
MTGEVHLETVTHIVSHLTREIESALRQALSVVKEASWPPAKKEGAHDAHEADVKAVLSALDIPEGSELARFWIGLTGSSNPRGLASWAHRRALAAPRARDAEFDQFWDHANSLLDLVLDRFEARYLLTMDALDSLLAISSPQARDAENLRQRIPNSDVNLRYFLSRVSNPQWLPLLEDQGYFTDPPEPEITEDGLTRVTNWPESQCLARMAAQASEDAVHIALAMPPTSNPSVCADLGDIALAVPPTMAVQLVPKIIACLQQPDQHQLPELAGELVAHLCGAGLARDAVELARETLAVLPDPRLTSPEGSPDHMLLEPRARCSTWEYGEILAVVTQPMAVAAGIRALELFCDLLELAVRFSMREAGIDGVDFSYYWCSGVEDSPTRRDDLRSLLVPAVRDAADAIVSDYGEKALSVVESRPFKIFQRLGVHLRRLHPNLDPARTTQIITSGCVVDDHHLWHELYLLQQERYAELPPVAKEFYLGLTDRGPAPGSESHSAVSREGEYAVRRWQYWRLFPIRDSLPEYWQIRLTVLRSEFPDVEYPDRPMREGGGWIGPVSPKTADDIAAMSVEGIVSYLQTWEPSGDSMAPTCEGMARQIQNAVAAEPVAYAKRASLWRILQPTYVRGLIAGLEAAAKESRAFQWEPVIELCRWVVEQPREDPDANGSMDDRDPGWGWTRRSIASLLAQGFADGPTSIPYTLRTGVWFVLEILMGDPDPTVAFESQYGSPNMEPYMLSINSVRGQALHAVMRYSLWARRGSIDFADVSATAQLWAQMPEVEQTLDRHLDKAFDSSLAVHSVYGQWLGALHSLSPAWTEANIARMLPSGKAQLAYRRAAWDAYILFNQPRSTLLSLLRHEYSQAIEELGSDSSGQVRLFDTNTHLADHLMAYYWHGQIGLSDSDGIAERFFANASGELSAHALSTLGDGLESVEDEIPPELLDSLVKLWENRVAVAQSHPELHISELQAFGRWFASDRLDSGWSLAQLRIVLSHTTDLEQDRQVVERLAILSQQYPLECAECIYLLLKGEPRWHLYAWGENPRTVLANAVRSSDLAVREEGRRIIDRLGAAEYLQFRDLLERSDEPSRDSDPQGT